MDYINIDRMDFFGYHGCLPEENKLGQRFYVDVSMGLNLRQAGLNDDLAATVNYAEVYAKVKAVVEGKPVKLIECLAEKIADTVMTAFLLIEEIKVTVHKPEAPIAGTFRDVNVSITRRR